MEDELKKYIYKNCQFCGKYLCSNLEFDDVNSFCCNENCSHTFLQSYSLVNSKLELQCISFKIFYPKFGYHVEYNEKETGIYKFSMKHFKKFYNIDKSIFYDTQGEMDCIFHAPCVEKWDFQNINNLKKQINNLIKLNWCI